MRDKYRHLIKDTFIFAIGNMGSKLILFFLVPFYTAYLTKEQYGTSELIFTVAQLVLPFISIVIFDALIRYGLSKEEKSEDVLLVATIVLFFGTLITILLTPLLSLYEPIKPWRWYLSVYIALSGFYSTYMNYLKVKNKNLWYTVISLVHTLLMAVLNIVMLAGYHLEIKGYLIAYIVSMAISLCFAIIVGRIPFELRKAHYSKRLFREMVRYSSPLILNNISWWVVHSSDKIMVERMIDADALGLYTVSAKIPALINVLINVFSQAWGISSVKEYENANDNKFYSSVLEIYVFICFGLSIALVAIIKPFMKLYVAADFYESWHYVPILLTAAAFASIAYFYGSLYGALKKSGRNMGTTFLAAITNIIVNYFGIKLVGTYGAALGTLIAYIVMAAVRIIDIGRFINIRVNWCRLLLVCILALVQSVFVTLDVYGYVVSIITVFIFIVLYRKYIKDMLITVQSKIKRK